MDRYRFEGDEAPATDYDLLRRGGLFPFKTNYWFDGSEQTE